MGQISQHIQPIKEVIWRNFVANPRELETNLEWFEKQISVKNLPSNAYFEKYLVVSLYTSRIKELIGQDNEAFLEPKTLFMYPCKE
jgi:hypothetical protein